jgi:hypothetical protein
MMPVRQRFEAWENYFHPAFRRFCGQLLENGCRTPKSETDECELAEFRSLFMQSAALAKLGALTNGTHAKPDQPLT